MPLYHFNVYDDVSRPDRDGTDLPDWQTARLEAVRLAAAVLKDDAERVALRERWHMKVTDDRGLTLLRLDFSVVRTPVPPGIACSEHGN